MSPDLLARMALVLAAVPAGLFVLNLLVYRPIRRRLCPTGASVSVLIPARNEERNIGAAIEAVLASRGCDFEVIVLDDHSSDRTAEIAAAIAGRDSRVRLESAPPLPPGWCGKPHGCHVLAQLARHPLLVFIDADVRLAPDALGRMAGFMERTEAALASGVPLQELGTFSERLLLPLIHFILLGFLPMHLMRWTKRPGLSAGCGQLFVARAEAYRRAGGHAKIRSTLHDGLKLPRLFRRAGFRTDLFDATGLATCRMYCSNFETWSGAAKNAPEGLAAPGAILPMTTLLAGGQVLPFFLLMSAGSLSVTGVILAGIAAFLAYLPRIVGVVRFRQPWGSAALHPFGVMALLALQWFALARALAGRPSVWKDRAYPSLSVTQPANKA